MTYDAAGPGAVRMQAGRNYGPFGKKEFKKHPAEQIPSVHMELGEYDHRAVEAGARELWESRDIYRYDRDGHGPVFSVDTPPPYVSAAHLHVGHAMSYQDVRQCAGLQAGGEGGWA